MVRSLLLCTLCVSHQPLVTIHPSLQGEVGQCGGKGHFAISVPPLSQVWLLGPLLCTCVMAGGRAAPSCLSQGQGQIIQGACHAFNAH